MHFSAVRLVRLILQIMADPEVKQYQNLIQNFKIQRSYQTSTSSVSKVKEADLFKKVKSLLLDLTDSQFLFAKILRVLFLLNLEHSALKQHLGDRKDLILSNEELAQLICDLFGPRFSMSSAPAGGQHQDWNFTHCITIKVFSLFMTLSRSDFRAHKHLAAFNNFYDCFFQQLFQHPDSVDYLNAIYEPILSRVDLHNLFSNLLSPEEEKQVSEDGGAPVIE